MMKTFFYLYQITNLVNNKIYVGVHKTKNIHDRYMGSGSVIKSAIKKYGIENFRKDILEFFNSADDMFVREKEIVTESFLLREDVYNLRRGGHGGFDYINSKPYIMTSNRKTGHLKRSEKLKGRTNSVLSEKLKQKHELGLVKIPDWTGRKHNSNTIEKMKGPRPQSTGNNNSQYGSMWIYNEELRQNKKISITDTIPTGWIKGRKIKF